ncbi:MAG: hypothetical protein ACYC4L_03865 [Chloroflexota bacterium]
MLGKRSDQRGLFEADHLCLDYVGRDSFYGFLASQRGQLFRDEEFAALNAPHNGSGGIVRVGRLLAAIYLPEGDKRGPRLLILRASLMAFAISLLQPLFFVVLPTLAASFGQPAGSVVTLGQTLGTILFVTAAATAYWLSNRLSGLSLREVLSLNRWSLVALWLISWLCVGALLLYLNDPLGFVQVTRLPSLKTGPNPSIALVFAAMFLALPGFYTLASYRWSQQLRPQL